VRPTTATDDSIAAVRAAAATAEAAAQAEAARRAEQQRVEAVIEQYVNALNARNLDGMVALYPGLPTGRQEGLRAMFRDASNFTALLASPPEITVNGDEAHAQFTYSMRGRSPSLGTFDQRATHRATLRRTASGWVIERMVAVP
jgi:hypothetical protein